jgi:hypothetical protein
VFLDRFKKSISKVTLDRFKKSISKVTFLKDLGWYF